MFKNKNRVTKISNGIFLVLGVLASLSLLSVFSSIGADIPKRDIYSNIILLIIYIICPAVILWITNKKIDLYKDEYSLSRQIFNLFLLLSLMAVILMISVNILSLIFYKRFSLYSLIVQLFCFVPIYIIAYIEVSKDKLLSIKNSKKVNVCNLVIIILLMNYVSLIITTLLQMLLNMIDVILALKNICISLGWIAIVLIAYKLMNKDV